MPPRTENSENRKRHASLRSSAGQGSLSAANSNINSDNNSANNDQDNNPDKMDRQRLKADRQNEAIAEYKRLSERLASICANRDPKEVLEIIRDDLQKIQEIYPRVKKMLPASSADAKHLKELLTLSNQYSKKIACNTRSFEMRDFILGIRNQAKNQSSQGQSSQTQRRITKEHLLKYIYENFAQTCIATTPTFTFLYGALKKESIVRAPPVARTRRVREKLPESKAVVAKRKCIDVDEGQDTTPKEVEYINEKLKDIAKDKPDAAINFFEALIDPKSFTQTVENIFHVSFLVKEGIVGVKPTKNDTGPVSRAKRPKLKSKEPMLIVEESSAKPQEREQFNQSILSFSMQDYKKWIAAYNIRQRAFPSAAVSRG